MYKIKSVYSMSLAAMQSIISGDALNKSKM